MKGVQDALRRLEGVDHVRVELQTNLVTITPEPDVELDLAAIPKAIRRAGFTPADMELVARGEFGERGGEPTFRIRGWTTPLRARADAEPPSGEIRLRARVEIEGTEPVLVPLPGAPRSSVAPSSAPSGSALDPGR